MRECSAQCRGHVWSAYVEHRWAAMAECLTRRMELATWAHLLTSKSTRFRPHNNPTIAPATHTKQPTTCP